MWSISFQISAVGRFELAVTLVDTLIVSVVMVVACLWVVYPLFPEDGPAPEPPPGAAQLAESPWIAIRATLIVMPTYLLALSNPGMYLAIVMKAVTLGQQVSEENRIVDPPERSGTPDRRHAPDFG